MPTLRDGRTLEVVLLWWRLRVAVGPLAVAVFGGVELVRYGVFVAFAGANLIFCLAAIGVLGWSRLRLRYARRRLAAVRASRALQQVRGSLSASVARGELAGFDGEQDDGDDEVAAHQVHGEDAAA